MTTRIENILSPDFQAFIEENQDADIPELLLSKTTKVDTKEAADQILARRKSKTKLPRWFSVKGIVFPPPLSVEQSSSDGAVEYKKKLLSGKHLIDLSGGMGADAIAFSEVFEQTVYVERDPWLCELFRHNSKLLSKAKVEVQNTNAELFLETFEGKASFFVDPARRDDHQNRVFRFEDCSPNIVLLLPALREKAQKVLVKAAPLIDLTQGLSTLDHVSEIHVLSIRNECKEVLFLMDFTQEVSEPTITCVNITTSGKQHFQFKLSEETDQKTEFGELSEYLYDPNASILKAGAFKSITAKYPIKKLAANTHLYTSDQMIPDFPGRVFKVLKDSPDKRNLNELRQANILTKNYPIKPEELKKKYKLKDGGDHFLIGFRDLKNKARLILTKK